MRRVGNLGPLEWCRAYHDRSSIASDETTGRRCRISRGALKQARAQNIGGWRRGKKSRPTGPDGKSMIAAVDARPDANNRIEVSTLPGTRVRMIGLYRLPSSIVSPVKRGSRVAAS